MREAKIHFFSGLVIKALLQKMPHDLGCCLQGNPKTEVPGSVAGSKETEKTGDQDNVLCSSQTLTRDGAGEQSQSEKGSQGQLLPSRDQRSREALDCGASNG